MFRLLTGLNKSDAVQELKQIGISSPDEQLIRWVCENISIKISGLTANGKLLADILGSTLTPKESFTIITAENEESIICLTRWAINKLGLEDGTSCHPFIAQIRQLLKNVNRRKWRYTIRDGFLNIDNTLIMGILNVTPDSFSDGGHFFSPEDSYCQARKMLDAGADIIDIGGESSRPGSVKVSADEEWERIYPALKRLVKLKNCIISIDTCKSEIARRALSEGAHIINDISGMTFDPNMADTVALFNAPVVLMHIKGEPETMQINPTYSNVAEELFYSLEKMTRMALKRGVRQIIVDPGIGFGKRWEDNFEIIRRLGELHCFGFPVMLGASRKSFIGKLLNLPPDKRLMGSVLSSIYGVKQGANILRVHDVEPVKQSLTTFYAIQKKKHKNHVTTKVPPSKVSGSGFNDVRA